MSYKHVTSIQIAYNTQTSHMKNIIFALVLTLILSGCFNKTKEDKAPLESFTRKLFIIETPISFNSNYETDLKAQDLSEDPFFVKIQNEYNGLKIYGLLFETKNFIAILGNLPTDSGTPIILTFDKKGNKIDAHIIYENAMGDIGIYIQNSGTIFPDRQITFIDSTLTRKLTDDGSDEIPGSDSLSVNVKKYKIDENGKFIVNE